MIADPAVQTDPDAWDEVEYGTLHLLDAKNWKTLYGLQKAAAAKNVHNVQWDVTGAIAAWGLGDKAASDAILNDAKTRYPGQLDLINSVQQQRDQIVQGGE